MPTGYPDYTFDVAGTLPVTSGGTGTTGFGANQVLLGNGVGPLTVAPPGGARQVFQVPAAGGAPQFQDPDVNNISVTPAVTAGGITLHGKSAAPAVSPAYSFYDDTLGGGRGVLSQIEHAGEWLSDSAVGDMVLANSVIKFGAGGGFASWANFSNSGLTLASKLINYQGTATAGNGLACILGTDTRSLQTGAVGPFTLIAAAPANGLYRISAYLRVVAVGGTGTYTVALNYQDFVGVSQLAVTAGVASAGGISGATLNFYQAAGAAVSYQVTASGTVTGSTYTVRVVLQWLG